MLRNQGLDWGSLARSAKKQPHGAVSLYAPRPLGYSALFDFPNADALPKNRSCSRFRGPICFASRPLQRTPSYFVLPPATPNKKSHALQWLEGFSPRVHSRSGRVLSLHLPQAAGKDFRIPTKEHANKRHHALHGVFYLAWLEGFEPATF